MPDYAAPVMNNTAPTEAAPSAPAAGASDGQSGEPTASGWFDALIGRGPVADGASDGDGGEPTGEDTQAAEAATPEPKAQAAEPKPTEPKPEPTEPGPDDPVRLTRTQLERQIQAEVDRREAKRAKEQAARAAREEKLRLAKEDPYGLADRVLAEDEQQATLEQQTQQTAEIARRTTELAATLYDQAIVNPIVSLLPREEQQRLHKEINPVGVDGRGRLVAAALEVLRKQEREKGAADAEKRLRKSSAFRKELLAELRDSEEEPELLPARGAGPAPADMDTLIRQAAGIFG